MAKAGHDRRSPLLHNLRSNLFKIPDIRLKYFAKRCTLCKISQWGIHHAAGDIPEHPSDLKRNDAPINPVFLPLTTTGP
jgi:hypothetical protein